MPTFGRLAALGREILLAPNLVSLTRLPLAVAFPLAIASPPWALVVLALAGLSDVVDGMLARRLGLVTATGAVLDPILDKLFVLTVVVTLIVSGQLPLGGALLLAVRELGELPLLVGWLSGKSRRGARSAKLSGKVATVLQFAAVAAALLSSRALWPLLVAAAAAGLWAAIAYTRRELSGRRGLSKRPA
jgi:cardiolipin synthase (CMP-forming)